VTGLAHHDTPPCPRCWAQTVVPFESLNAAAPEGAQTPELLVCVSCGAKWHEKDQAVVTKAWTAQKAWQKYRAEAQQIRTREKRAKR